MVRQRRSSLRTSWQIWLLHRRRCGGCVAGWRGGGCGSQLSQFHMIGQNLRWDLPDSPKDFTWLYRSSRLSECKCLGLKLNKLGKMFSTCLRIWIPTLWHFKMTADPTQLDLDSGAKMFTDCFHLISNTSGAMIFLCGFQRFWCSPLFWGDERWTTLG